MAFGVELLACEFKPWSVTLIGLCPLPPMAELARSAAG
jgi:hypothetical protein